MAMALRLTESLAGMMVRVGSFDAAL
jgi:hypothetical protein